MNNMKNYLEVAEFAAIESGKILMKFYQNVKFINKKGEGGNLVTEADELAEKKILEIITKEFPDHKILSEESGYNNIKDSDYLWAIDPLDGTTNYSHGYPIFAVSIALLKDKKPIIGVVNVPFMNALYKAEVGKGATLNNKEICVTNSTELTESLLVTGFPYDRAIIEDNNYREYQHLSNLTHGVRRSGSAAFDLVSVASGKIDGFWENSLNLWDISAGWLIVKEAGGKVTGLDSEEIKMQNIGLIASNKTIHKELSNELKFIRNYVNF
ncbi:MAG: inositol monophosphatase family protein [Clostridiales bacterium]